MNKNIRKYYHEVANGATSGNFHKVIPLQEHLMLDWETLQAMVPDIFRAWFELARLPTEQRIEFTHDYWISRFASYPHAHDSITQFFTQIDDIGIYLIQDTLDAPFQQQMVYSLEDDSGFFQGSLPCSSDEIIDLRRGVREHQLPADYLAFMEIHNGFSKYSDTGVLSAKEMRKKDAALQQLLDKEEAVYNVKGDTVNPHQIIPFYESFGRHCYQCFYGDWYPEQEMGNLYFSEVDKLLADLNNKSVWEENLSFPTFLDWLAFYLEKVG